MVTVAKMQGDVLCPVMEEAIIITGTLLKVAVVEEVVKDKDQIHVKHM